MTASPQELVYETLKGAIDQNPEVFRKAEEKLISWECEAGFFHTLVQIFQNQGIDVNIRWFSAVYFKNGILKYWRRNVKNEIAESEKQQIRAALMFNIDEPIPQVASQVAVLMGKIAKLDYPRDWPELLPFLLDKVRSQEAMHQQRALLILVQVIKAIASKRMMADKKIFNELTGEIFGFIYQLNQGFTADFFRHIQENSPQEMTINSLEKAITSIRILRKLTIYGIPKPHRSSECMFFIQNLFSSLKQSLELRYEMRRLNASTQLLELTEKFIVKQMKILNEFLEHHPVSFVHFISTALEFSFNYAFSEGVNLIVTDSSINFEPFAILCINLMRGILHSNVYNTYVQENAPEDADVSIALTAKKDFFTNERITFICEKILGSYLIWTPTELEQWAEDPESFAAVDAGETWKYGLKPCVENLYLVLFNVFRTEMTEEVVGYIRKSQDITLTSESAYGDILAKDAIYLAAGLSAFKLFDELDFDKWFVHQLVAEIRIPGDNFRILRRRIIWLVGQWTGVKFSKMLRPTLYEICLQLLSSNEDMFIKLTAAKTLAQTIDDFEFQPDQFKDYLSPTFSALFDILKKANECDTKMSVLATMSSIVDKMASYIQPHAENFIAYLPLLWDESQEYNMLRCSIISTLQNIVKVASEIPEMLTQFLYSVINYSTNVAEPAHVYLMEEGLELWLTVVENSNELSPLLLELAKNLLPIIEQSSENMRTVLYITKSYILLNFDIFLSKYGTDIVSTYSYLLNDLGPAGVALIMKIFETIIRSDAKMGIEILRPILPHIFLQVYEDKDFTMVFSSYITIIARVFLYDQNVFVQFLPGNDFPKNFEVILDNWINRMPLIAESDKRKILSLALGALVSSIPNPLIESRINGIMQNISYSLNEIMREEEDSANLEDDMGTSRSKNAKILIDTLVYGEEMYEWESLEYTTQQIERRRKIDLKDPVHTIILTDYIDSQLEIVKNKIGEDQYTQLLSSLDPKIISDLKEFLNAFNDIKVPDFKIEE